MPPRFKPVQADAKPARSSQPLTGQVDEFVHYLRAECGMAENSVKAYSRDIQQFFEWMQRRKQTDFRRLDLPQLTNFLKILHDQGLQASSIARKLVALKTYFRFLVLEAMAVFAQGAQSGKSGCAAGGSLSGRWLPVA